MNHLFCLSSVASQSEPHGGQEFCCLVHCCVPSAQDSAELMVGTPGTPLDESGREARMSPMRFVLGVGTGPESVWGSRGASWVQKS